MVDINAYTETLRTPFMKLCRLRFLNPDGTVAFIVDNGVIPSRNFERNRCFISSGELSVNLQSGQRRSASVTFDNVNDEFSYNVNHIWFGSELALDEGLLLPDGTEYYLPQGIFLLSQPSETLASNANTITYNLLDKWANLDGTLYGNLEGAYEIPIGSDPFDAIAELLAENKGNGNPVDNLKLVNDFKTWESIPYTVSVDADGTLADVVTNVAETLGAVVGYDQTGRLRFEPSSDILSDSDRPVQWRFGPNDVTLLGLTYDIKNEEVFNDYIVLGEELSDGSQPSARVQNVDPKSPTNVNLIGRKTKRETSSGYGTHQQCLDLAMWRLKRATVLSKAVNISASQIFHLQENQLVEIIREDKEDTPIERHLVQGFSRPLATTGAMTISAISTVDIPEFTVVEL